MTKLSVTVITFNEEENIERCLQSVKKVADEIVVVDSFSPDRTKEICRSYDVVFIENSFHGYIEQKNFAVSKASGDYVLSIDADEALSEDLISSILEEKKKGFPADGYSMNRSNYYCGKWIRHGTFYPDRKLRLFNRKKGKFGGYNPHDAVRMTKGSSVKKLKGDLLHYTYKTFEEHAEKTKQFSTIAAEALYKKGVRPSGLKKLTSSVWSFIHSYCIKLGFLDGKRGYMIAKFTGQQSFLKYDRLFRLRREMLEMQKIFEHDIEECLKVLGMGGVILYPTDTIWGIGCDATNSHAVARIFQLKQRQDEKAMIVLVADERDVLQYVANPDPRVFDYLETISKPTTVIYEGAMGLADNLTGKDGSVAIRITHDIFCRHLIKKFQKPIVSTSANISGGSSPRFFADIHSDIVRGVDYTVHYRQKDMTIAESSSIIKWNKDGSHTVLRP